MLDADPLIVRSRVAHQAGAGDQSGGQRTEHLHFLPAHHVGMVRVAERQSGDDRDAVGFGPAQAPRKIDRARGAGDIKRFDPAAGRSDHSGQQHRQIAKRHAKIVDRGGKAVGWDRKNSKLVLDRGDAFAVPVDPIGAAVGRPPVHRDEAVVPAHGHALHIKNAARDHLVQFSFRKGRL